MKQLLIWISSFLLAGIIISPFFWLKFLKKKSKLVYVLWSSIITASIFIIFIYFINKMIGRWLAKGSSDIYFIYDDISFISIMITHLLIILSPFLFTKIVYEKLSLKSFFLSVFISIIIFVIYAYVFVYIFLPKAFGELLKRL